MVLGRTIIELYNFSLTGLSPSLVNLSRLFDWIIEQDSREVPLKKSFPASLISQRIPAWHDMSFIAVPVSLTTTQGITFVFSSYPYLDVSVQGVRLFTLCIQIKILEVCSSGFPHSEIFGSMLDWQLPKAYSSLLLPSSPSDTKASTKMPFSITYNVSKVFRLFYFQWLLRQTQKFVAFFIYLTKLHLLS